jgi:hypothetical protein
MRRSPVLVLAWIVAVAFFAGTVMFLVDRLNLYVTPPVLPDSAGMVERTLGTVQYRQAIWPVFLLTYAFYAIGFVAVVVFGGALAGFARGGQTFGALLTTGGILGAISAIIPIGSVEAAVWLGYCDCVERESEIVSQVWAQMVVQDVGRWLLRAAFIVLAIGVLRIASELREALSPTARTLGYLLAIGLIASPIIGFVGRTDPFVGELLDQVIAAILVPVWAIVVGRAVTATQPASSA